MATLADVLPVATPPSARTSSTLRQPPNVPVAVADTPSSLTTPHSRPTLSLGRRRNAAANGSARDEHGADADADAGADADADADAFAAAAAADDDDDDDDEADDDEDGGAGAGADTTLVLHPPFTASSQQSVSTSSPPSRKVVSLSLVPPLLVCASPSAITTFCLAPSAAAATILAQWPAPRDHAVIAVRLSPDAAVLAAVVQRVRHSAVLVLFDPRHFDLLVRLSIPPAFTSVAFFSARHAVLDSCQARTSPPDLLPPRFRRLVALHQPRATPLAAEMPDAPPAEDAKADWALAVAAPASAKTAIMYSFARGYTRIHRVFYNSLPDSIATSPTASLACVPHIAARSRRRRNHLLVCFTPAHAFVFFAGRFHPLISHADFPIVSVLAVTPPRTFPHASGVALAALWKPDGSLAIAVHDGPTLVLTTTPLQCGEVCALAQTANGQVHVAASDGRPRLLAVVHDMPSTPVPKLAAYDSRATETAALISSPSPPALQKQGDAALQLSLDGRYALAAVACRDTVRIRRSRTRDG